MANPEQGNNEGDLTPGTWALAEIEIPPVLDNIRLTIDNVAQLLLTILNLFATVLNAARAFALSFLDPLVALVEGLIELIESTIKGLQNIGIYIHGDFYLLKDAPQFRKLLGGYSAYERRMLNRLLDPADPNRPDFDKGTTSVAFFFYVNSGDISGILKVLTFLIGFMKLFGVDSKTRVRSMGTVTDVRVKYGSEGTQGIINKPLFEALIDRQNSADTPKGLKQAGEPDLATLEWRLAAAPGNFVSPVANLGPGGFYVEVSVDPIPYFIQYDTVPGGKVEKVEEETSEATPAPNRVRGLCVDEEGNTIRVTGGVSQLDFFRANGSDFFSVEGSEPRAFLFKSTASTEQIPLSMGISLAASRETDSKQFLQKTFFVTNKEAGGLTSGSTLTYTIKHSDMPLRATFDEDGNVNEDEATLPDSFYVRIRPVGDTVESPEDLGYHIFRDPFTQGTAPVQLSIRTKNAHRPDEKITSMDRGEASSPLKITYPGSDTGQYLRCVFTATLILALVRPDLLLAEDKDGKPITDLSEWGPLENKVRKLTGLEDLAVIMLPKILGVRSSEKFFKGSFKTSVRKAIYNRCAALTARLYRENNPAASIQKLVVERCKDLVEFTFKDSLVFDDTDSLVLRDLGAKATFPKGDDDPREFTIIQAMLSENESIGIGMNPTSVGAPEDSTGKNVASQLCKDTNVGDIPGYWLEHFYEKVTERFDEALAVTIESESFETTLLREEDVNSSSQIVVQGDKQLLSGSVINSPVCYVRRGPRVTKIAYCRNIFEDLYESAAFALGVANGPLSKGTDPDGGWITVRLGMMIPELDMFLDSIISWMKALVSAGNSIGKTIRQYIDYVQARIIELQTLIQRINSLLQNLLSIFGDLPAAALLTVISQGSEGIIEGLVTAQNKPGDGPGSYSAGAVVVMAAPTLFTFFIDLLKTDE